MVRLFQFCRAEKSSISRFHPSMYEQKTSTDSCGRLLLFHLTWSPERNPSAVVVVHGACQDAIGALVGCRVQGCIAAAYAYAMLLTAETAASNQTAVGVSQSMYRSGTMIPVRLYIPPNKSGKNVGFQKKNVRVPGSVFSVLRGED